MLPAPPAASTGGSDAESGSDVDDDEDSACIGMMSLLKSFAAPLEKPSAKAKPKAKPTPAAPKQQRAIQAGGTAKKVRLAPDPQASAAAAPAAAQAPADRSEPKSKKRKVDACPFDEEPVHPTMEGELSDADKQVLDGFTVKLDELKDLKPPLADNAFKSNLQELTTKLNGIKADLKTKKRSASRRTLKTEDPLYIALDAVEQSIARLMQLVRCSLPQTMMI